MDLGLFDMTVLFVRSLLVVVTSKILILGMWLPSKKRHFVVGFTLFLRNKVCKKLWLTVLFCGETKLNKIV